MLAMEQVKGKGTCPVSNVRRPDDRKCLSLASKKSY